MRSLITLAFVVFIIAPTAEAGDGNANERNKLNLDAVALAESVKHSIVRVEVAGTNKVGTGFVFDPAGLILTNYHVVSPVKANEPGRVHVEFVTEEGKPVDFEAVIHAFDELSDLAVLSLVINDVDELLGYGILNRHRRFQALTFAKDAQVGEWVLAVGFALGLRGMPTVSRGLVSAVGRDAGGTLSCLIQTDACINPGNSGGPLLNAAGEVVGINTLRLTSRIKFEKGIQQEPYYGISYARSYETVATFAQQLKEKRRVDRIDLGLAKSSNFTALKREGSFFPWTGVLVEEFKDQSVLKAAGLQKDDVIRAMFPATSDGQPVEITYVSNTGELDNVLGLLYGTPSIIIYYYRFKPEELAQIRGVNVISLEIIKKINVPVFHVKVAAAPAPGDGAKALLQRSPSAATTQAAP